jgi:hypothetical protein
MKLLPGENKRPPAGPPLNCQLERYWPIEDGAIVTYPMKKWSPVSRRIDVSRWRLHISEAIVVIKRKIAIAMPMGSSFGRARRSERAEGQNGN